MPEKEEQKLNRERKVGGYVITETVRMVNFMKTLGVNWGYFALAIIFSLIVVLFQTLNIQFFMVLLRGMIAHDFTFVTKVPMVARIVKVFLKTPSDSSSIIFVLISVIFFCNLMKGGLQYAADLGVSYQVRRATNALRGLIFERYLKFGKLFYDRASLGRLNTVLVKFSQAISNQLNSLQKLVGQLFSLTAYFGIMLFISWKLTILTLCIFPVFVLLNRRVTLNLRGVSKDHARSEEHLDDKIFSVLSAIPLVKAHHMEEEEKKLFNAVNEEEALLAFRLDKKEKLINPIQELSMMVAFLILVCAVTFFLPAGNRHISSYLVFFYLVRLSMPGFNAINQFRMALDRSGVRIEKIIDVLKDEKKFILRDGSREFQGLRDKIEFQGLNFGYENLRPVLREVSVCFEKGKMTAIVGPTGSGKTSLVHLLMRFYDCPPGTVLLDGNDIRDFTLKSIMVRMAYVSQDIFFFNNTVRMNLTYGLKRSTSEQELTEVVQKARLLDLITRLPEGLDTRIGERGVQLSGGERQRLAIARALLRGAEILILDEATSALDATTEKLVQEAISEAVAGKTSIVIAHRLSTVQHADKIVVMKEGRIVEEGAPQVLLEKHGKFFEFCQAQKFF